ncbi:hypothetical protein Q3G72_019831 [Acer saccharum]|nr:hypothetical protein Q3G72_019831 [Acer saccharum]
MSLSSCPYSSSSSSSSLRVRASFDTQQRLSYNPNAPKNPKKTLASTAKPPPPPPLTLTTRLDPSVFDLLKIPSQDVWLPNAPKVQKPRSVFNAAALAYMGDCIYESERRGRPKGLKNKIRLEIRRMLGEATLHDAHARFKEAISVLTEVVMFNPCLPDTYHTLGLVYDTIGNAEKAAGLYELAAENDPKDLTLWNGFLPILFDSGIIDSLASVFMETNAYDKALQHIEHSHLVYYSGEELPLNLKIRAGICHIHLGNMEKSEVCRLIFTDICYLLFIFSVVNL